MHRIPTLLRFVVLLWLAMGLRGMAQQQTAMAVAGMPAEAPVVVTARHDGRTLEVVFDLRKGWHVYVRDVGGGQPVVVRVTDGAFVAGGDLLPPVDRDGQVEGKAAFRLPLQRVGVGEALAAQVDFMVCDALECLPPITLELRAEASKAAASPLRVLLVAVDEEARTQRIAGFLRERGCEVVVTTYAAVRSDVMERSDVVLADSPTFRLVKGQTANARKFPQSSTPIVAVGFLGTELIEAHQVAMTSGYI